MKTLESAHHLNPSAPPPLCAAAPSLFSPKQRNLFLLLLIAALLLRLLAMALVPLIPEEAYYWMYAHHPSLSYFDHPAMVAWIIQLGTAIFGNTEFGVRIVNDLLMLGASGVMYAFARQWWGKRASLWAALSLQVLPVYFGTGFTGMMDGALVFWWLVCLLGVSLAVRKNKMAAWYLAGLGFGGAMQSKYSAVFLAPSALIFLLAYPPYRKHLKSPHAWLGLFLGVVLFTPTILWNAQHVWASFRFQFLSRSNQDPINASTILEFLVFQLAILTPLVLGGAVVVLKRVVIGRRAKGSGFRVQNPDSISLNPEPRARNPLRRPHWLFAFSFCLPLVAALAFKSLREAHLNWTIPAWLSLLPALAHTIIARMRLRRRNAATKSTTAPDKSFDWRPGMVLTAWICLAINVALILYLVLIQPRVGGIEAFGPWKPLARSVQSRIDPIQSQAGRPLLVIANGKYRLASILAFYRLPHDPRAFQNTTSQWILDGQGLGYPYWLNRRQWVGRDCLYITQSQDIQKEVAPFFDRIQILPPIHLPHQRPYNLALCQGLK
jgi:dolichol-phosphate mannosyltransferase